MISSLRSAKALTSGCALAIAFASTAVFAQSATPSPQPVSYNFAGLRYVSQNLDDFDCTQDGLNLHGSLDFNSGWFAQAGYTDVSGGGCGSSTLSALGGYRTPFNDIFYMYGKVGFESLSVDAGGSDSGLILAGGLRGMIQPNIELQLELGHHTVGDGDTNITGTGAYWFAPNLAGTLDLTLSSEGTALGIGARYNF